MEDGFIIDNTYGGRMASTWVEGEPVKSLWKGIRVKDKQQRVINSYRCTACGYLECYAR
jgi:hypothetical protein